MLTGPMIEKSMRDDQNLTVMLKDADIFSMTGYKVLQSQEKDRFREVQEGDSQRQAGALV